MKTLDIIHRPVFYLKHDVSETGFCLNFQVEIQLHLKTLDIIHRPVFELKHEVSETGFCLNFRVEIQLHPVYVASLSPDPETETTE
jgi:hypothetical protein